MIVDYWTTWASSNCSTDLTVNACCKQSSSAHDGYNPRPQRYGLTRLSGLLLSTASNGNALGSFAQLVNESRGEWVSGNTAGLYYYLGPTVNERFYYKFISLLSYKIGLSLTGQLRARLTAGRGFLAYRCGETQARAHALLPLAAPDLAFVKLFERDFQLFATQLPHLDVEQRRNDRH